MTDWSLIEREWLTASAPMPYDPYQFAEYDPYYRDKQQPLPPPPPPPPPQQPTLPTQQQPPQAQPFLTPSPPSSLTLLLASPQHLSPPAMPMLQHMPAHMPYMPVLPKVDTPRELRNKAEKQRRDKLNQSISQLAALVPPVVYSGRKIDKTGILRYTAHYLRAHQYVFDTKDQTAPGFTQSSTQALLGLLNGFMLTTTYRGLIVVVSQNVTEYLGYTELELLGRSIFSIIHEEDRQIFREQLMPRTQMLGHSGELLVPNGLDGREKVAEALANEKRSFVVRFMKLGQRSDPSKYVTCHVEGSLRMSDRACRGYNRCCQMVRRARARSDNPCSSGNDVVFVGAVRPSTETFINESALESYRMEYKTRHSIDGEIIQCEQRISLVTGYMTSEVSGVNAMNFIHRDEVRWVVVALKEMYNTNQLYGESCYRLMTKNGQFIYMRTRGKLDIEVGARAVTSFVCTNTVVDEEEGKHLIKMMKERFSALFNKYDSHSCNEIKDANDSEEIAVEDPRQLEKVILNLVTNLPQSSTDRQNNLGRGESPSHRLAIIPPKKERIVSAIEKIYTVIKSIPKQPSVSQHKRLGKKTAQLPFSTNISKHTSFNDAHFQIHSGSETELKSETACSPAASSDFEFIPVVKTNLYDEISSGEFSHVANVNNTETEMKFEILSPTPYRPAATERQGLIVADDMPLPSLSAAGMKRSSNDEFDDEETTTKKKVIDSHNEYSAANDQLAAETGSDSPTLEAFFDDAVIFSQIQSAIDSLDNIDPSFPDLLISNEVDDMLDTIQEGPE